MYTCNGSYSLFLTVAMLLFLQAASRTLFITPDHHSTNSSNTFTLSQCVSNSVKCFTSNTQLVFFPGLHDLKKKMIFQNIRSFSMIGNHGTINCANSSVGIAFINVTKILLKDIKLKDCSATFYHLYDLYDLSHFYDYSVAMLRRNAALHLFHCVSVTVTNVSIIVTVGTDGLAVVNAMEKFVINNVLVSTINSHPYNSSAITNGLVVHYIVFYKSYKYTVPKIDDNLMYIQSFTYKQLQADCSAKRIYNAFNIYFNFQSGVMTLNNILVTIDKVVLMDLCNTHALNLFIEHIQNI